MGSALIELDDTVNLSKKRLSLEIHWGGLHFDSVGISIFMSKLLSEIFTNHGGFGAF